MNEKRDNDAIPEALLQRLADYLTVRVGLLFTKKTGRDSRKR